MSTFLEGQEPQPLWKILQKRRQEYTAANRKRRHYAAQAALKLREMRRTLAPWNATTPLGELHILINNYFRSWVKLGEILRTNYTDKRFSTWPPEAQNLLAKTIQSKSALTSRKAYMLCKRLTAMLLAHADKKHKEDVAKTSN